MVITKTRFMNYMRCPRYAALDIARNDFKNSDLSYEEYLLEEENYKLQELMGNFQELDIFEDEEDESLEIMMPYYNEIEVLAGKHVTRVLGGESTYHASTFLQESFDFSNNSVKFLCYVDIYNQQPEAFNIIEVKATTSRKYKELTFSLRGQEKYDLFEKNQDGIYQLNTSQNHDPDINKAYNKKLDKLTDRFDDCGKYVYDLAIQRFIIEQELKGTDRGHLIPKIKYYLATLNHEYVFDGKYVNDQPVYDKDLNGNDIIVLFDMTDITKLMQDKIEIAKNNIITAVHKNDSSKVLVGKWCELKKRTECRFKRYCYSELPANNSVLNYINLHTGAKLKVNGTSYDQYDLINDGMYNMTDVPRKWLEDLNLTYNKKLEQWDAVKNYQEYIDNEKIRAKLDSLEYPLYHLDFETFPCPIPRFNGEKCYTQSLFQYSLHIEKKEGVCDFNKDHYEYLNKTFKDERRQLVESLLSHIDVESKGTIVVYNQGFEKSRLKEMGEIYPDLKPKIIKMIDMMFDLMLLIKGNEKMFTALQFNAERAKMFNYYHPGLSGSYSIKKVLPLFTELSYQGMPVGNGMEAVSAFAKMHNQEPELYNDTYNHLRAYCKQDTWAMVKILEGLRKKNVSTSVERIAL